MWGQGSDPPIPPNPGTPIGSAVGCAPSHSPLRCPVCPSHVCSKVQLRGWPMGIRGHIDGHHNARLNNHVALVAKYYCPDAGSGSQCRVLQLLATPHSTKRSVACSPDDADNARKRWIPESAGPLAQRASAGQPIAWTYSLSWVPDAVSPPQQRGERTMARLQTSSAATAPAPRAVALEPPVAAEVQSSSEGRASPVLRHAVVKGRGQGNTEVCAPVHVRVRVAVSRFADEGGEEEDEGRIQRERGWGGLSYGWVGGWTQRGQPWVCQWGCQRCGRRVCCTGRRSCQGGTTAMRILPGLLT